MPDACLLGIWYRPYKEIDMKTKDLKKDLRAVSVEVLELEGVGTGGLGARGCLEINDQKRRPNSK